MDLLSLYQEIDLIIRKIDFDHLFPGFQRYRYALYTNETICLDGMLLPYDERFRGNTSILFGEEYIAIWNVELDPVNDTELLASSLVHEMFHCHQNTLGETRYPSDLRLLNYPADTENFTRKYNENLYLADAYENSDAHALSVFAAIRNLRFSKHPEMVREEWKAETLEGMAEYIGLKALEHVNGEKFSAKTQSYLGLLRSESTLQFDVRRISYYTGTILFLCLDRLDYAIQNDIGSDLTVYEQTPLPAAQNAAIRPYGFIETAYAQLVSERKQKIEEHTACAAYTECDSEICGYDPMNMFRWENMIYCSHFVCLRIDGTMQMFPRKIVLVLKDGSDRAVTGYY